MLSFLPLLLIALLVPAGCAAVPPVACLRSRLGLSFRLCCVRGGPWSWRLLVALGSFPCCCVAVVPVVAPWACSGPRCCGCSLGRLLLLLLLLVLTGPLCAKPPGCLLWHSLARVLWGVGLCFVVQALCRELLARFGLLCRLVPSLLVCSVVEVVLPLGDLPWRRLPRSSFPAPWLQWGQAVGLLWWVLSPSPLRAGASCSALSLSLSFFSFARAMDTGVAPCARALSRPRPFWRGWTDETAQRRLICSMLFQRIRGSSNEHHRAHVIRGVPLASNRIVFSKSKGKLCSRTGPGGTCPRTKAN